MRIELRKLKIIRALSEETPCYTAEIWIDGAIAFHARNHGHGGADDYRQVGPFSEAEVNDWLKVNRPGRTFNGVTLPPGLEHEVARLMDEAEQLAHLRRRLRSNIVTIEDGEVYTYALKGRPATAMIAAIRTRKPGIEVVNETGEPGLIRAVGILTAQADAADAVESTAKANEQHLPRDGSACKA